MTDQSQTTLIPESELPPAENQVAPPVSSDATILAALGAFERHMRDEGFALNTTKAFASDVRLLGKFLGVGQPIGQIATKDLNDFFLWLMNDRGVPCSPKSYARRVTTIKVFFSWLHKAGVLPEDPANAVIQRSVRSPIPTLPTEDDIEKALAVTQRIRVGTADQKPDARPHLLLTLLLKTGIKKGEAMTMVPNHIDRSHADTPMLFVRYANPRLRYKERRLPLEPEWLDVLDEYLGQYTSPDTLFTCTARNLEYVLSDVGDEIGLAQGLLSFENLRWFCALSDYKAGEEYDEIRQKLGLSKITWRETKAKLEQLAKPEE
jgi:integrase/recombinase XerD